MIGGQLTTNCTRVAEVRCDQLREMPDLVNEEPISS